MKIAFLTTQINLKTGGGSNIVPDLKASSMQSLGHQVSIITLFPEKNSFYKKPSYAVIESPTRFKNWLMLQIKILFILRKYERDFDVFSFEGEHFIWGAGLYRMLKGRTPVLLHFNGFIYSIYEHGATYKAEKLPQKSLKGKISSWLRIFFEKKIGLVWANHIDIFTATTPIIKEGMENFGLNKNKVVQLVDFADLEPFFKNNFARCTMPKDKINILFAGRFVPEKGPDVLLSAIKEMTGENKNKILVHMVGAGPERERLVELTKKYQIEDKIIFYPWCDLETLSNLYHCADISIHPGRWMEPFSLIVPYAMASGLPVIVPEVSGSAWAAGEGGLTFKNGDYRDLKNKIEQLVNNESLRKDLAKKGKKRAQQLDYRNFVKTLEGLFVDLTTKKSS